MNNTKCSPSALSDTQYLFGILSTICCTSAEIGFIEYNCVDVLFSKPKDIFLYCAIILLLSSFVIISSVSSSTCFIFSTSFNNKSNTLSFIFLIFGE